MSVLDMAHGSLGFTKREVHQLVASSSESDFAVVQRTK